MHGRQIATIFRILGTEFSNVFLKVLPMLFYSTKGFCMSSKYVQSNMATFRFEKKLAEEGFVVGACLVFWNHQQRD